MMPVVTAFWDKLPGWLRKSLLILFILFYTPWWVREQVISFVDSRVHATITPLKDRRDAEITDMKEDISEIKQGVFRIEGYFINKDKK